MDTHVNWLFRHTLAQMISFLALVAMTNNLRVLCFSSYCYSYCMYIYLSLCLCAVLCNLSYKQEKDLSSMEAIHIFNKNTLEQSHNHFPYRIINLFLSHIICNHFFKK